MKHKKTAIIISVCLFVAIAFSSVYMICTVKKVTLNYACSTERTVAEAEEQKKMLDGYIGKSIFSVRTDRIYSSISSNPYLKVVSVNLKYPSELSVTVEERTESFCIEYDGKYYFVSDDLFVLAVKEGNNARADGLPLVCIGGDTVLPVVNGKLSFNGDVVAEELFLTAKGMMSAFSDHRNEIEGIVIDRYNEESAASHNEWQRIYVYTSEGASFTVTEATDKPAEKIKLLHDVYSSLSGEDRVARSVVIYSMNDDVAYE